MDELSKVLDRGVSEEEVDEFWGAEAPSQPAVEKVTAEMVRTIMNITDDEEVAAIVEELNKAENPIDALIRFTSKLKSQ